MNYAELYENIIRTCDICKGSGIENSSEHSISFCHCTKHYMFMVQMLELGVPINRIFDFKKIDNLRKTQYYFFKDDASAFNTYMTLVEHYRLVLCDSGSMFKIGPNDLMDGVMIYNLGLETFQNSSVVLYRLLKEICSRNLIGIFAFDINRDSLKTFYPDYIYKVINGETKF